MGNTVGMFVRSAFFFIVAVTFGTLFVWCMVQGVLAHFANDNSALFYYFASWLSGVGAFALYMQAKSLFHYATISK